MSSIADAPHAGDGARAARILSRILLVGALLGAASASAADINLGVIAGMTGAGASYGRGIAQGAEMAVREINAAGGINGRKLRLVVVDDASSPARSAIAMRRLVAANVDLIVGGWGSPQVLANLDIAEQGGIPYIVVGATHPQITSAGNRWTFRVIQTDAVMAEQLARIVVKDLGMKRIAVINDSNAYGVGNRDVFVAALARARMPPVEVRSYQTADASFTEQLTRIRAADPDAIAIFGTIPAAPAIMNQARELGIKARFVGTGGLANEALIASAPVAAEGAVLMTYFSEEVDAEARAWADRYRQEFAGRAEPPRPVLAAWEYRAIRAVAAPCLSSAAAATTTDRPRLRACIAQWRGKLFGVRGEAYFDQTGQLVQTPVVVEVRDGAFRSFKTAD
jgi:branched-chain amino acid transport system substrate-binding protein